MTIASPKPEAVYESLPSQAPVRDTRQLRRGWESSEALAYAGDAFPPDVSVIILTLNEELNLPCALASVSGSNDVVVLDSGSSDRTIAIAEAAGARVVLHDFVTSADQRQWALDNIDFNSELIFVLDADEWVSRALSAELTQLASGDGPWFAAAWARSRYVYEGRWIPRSSLYPSWTMRLLRAGCVRYENRMVNAHPVTSGPELRLKQDLVHEDRKSFAARLRKLDRYARLEALETERLRSRPISALREASTWRRRVKVVHSLLPFRASLKAIALLARGGLFEGRAGLHYIEDAFIQERLTTRYLAELRRHRQMRDEH